MVWFKKKAKNQNKEAILSDKKAEAERTESGKERQDLSKKTKEHLKSKRKYEEDRIQFHKTMGRVGLIFGAVGMVLGLAGVGAVAGLTPLKRSEPFVLRVDNNTGAVDIVQPISDSRSTTYGEVLDKYWLAQYVIERESYDWQLIQNSFDRVKLMSVPNVFSEYNAYITSKRSPVLTFKEDKKVRVQVLSVSFINNIGQVRFSKTVLNANGQPDNAYPVTNWLATIAFDYKKEIKLEQDRRANPLGFEAISYRVDSENITGGQ
ncbi:type IV secretion system protein [Bisgaard Taxon 10/6]|uniref:virB8 family protein n=1 Tax=Exercitatus varius TaxID=67857 RepID=UPI00294B5082|nr:type IV secretion system protein [Exercitatus varius]MDG2957049.1 type IV secretion system protein [Exercitatus varius]MDG2965263.1 type IV secretion system protein [Exercitatus varius]